MVWVEWGILVHGAVVVWLLTRRGDWRWLACPLGLAGQGLWVWLTWRRGEWGILTLSVVYAWYYGRGVWLHRRMALGSRVPGSGLRIKKGPGG